MFFDTHAYLRNNKIVVRGDVGSSECMHIKNTGEMFSVYEYIDLGLCFLIKVLSSSRQPYFGLRWSRLTPARVGMFSRGDWIFKQFYQRYLFATMAVESLSTILTSCWGSALKYVLAAHKRLHLHLLLRCWIVARRSSTVVNASTRQRSRKTLICLYELRNAKIVKSKWNDLGLGYSKIGLSLLH